MSELDASVAAPFSRRSALLLVLFGAVVFVALLWMIGNGLALGSTNDGGGHVDGRGLNGYAALSDYLERRGYQVKRARTEGGLKQTGLLVLTPPADAKGEEIAKVVAQHRSYGPTLVLTPKWAAGVAGPEDRSAKSGWVRLFGPRGPQWPGFLDDVSVDFGKAEAGRHGWLASGVAGMFPRSDMVMSGAGDKLVPLVMSPSGRRIYAAYVDDGDYPRLRAIAPEDWPSESAQDDGEAYPLLVVFDPDLLDNYGMAREPSARLAEALMRATAADGGAVIFDLTLNGLGRSANLLTLAFTPPFLAATLCLMLAAAGVGWRAFLRFGPPRVAGRAIAFGKRALVVNSAGLIRRSGRLHLLGPPYADAARQRLARAFALSARGPRDADIATEFAAIDRAGKAGGADDHAFSQVSARLVKARSANDLVKAAQDLHALERTLTR